MKLTNSIKSIAIGSFDGIHLAHQRLISQVEAVVVIEKNSATLTHGYKRVEYIKKPTFFYHLNIIKSLSAREFIEKLQIDFPKLNKIVVGYDFYFGFKKRGNTTLLKEIFGGEVIIIDEVKYNNISIHSCIIKSFISNGNILMANSLLNHNYKISGRVIKGQGLGKKELFPTINLKVQNYTLPKEGVYVSKTLIDNIWFNSITFLGHRVSTDGSYAIETHIIDRDIEFTKDEIEIEFIDFIRSNQKFTNLKELKEQIKRDIDLALEILNSNNKGFINIETK